MILQFSFSNYKCFRERQTLTFTASNADKSLPGNLISPNLRGLKKQKWVKSVGIYGANASGKTTVIEALEALANLVRESAKTTDPKSPISQIEPFALASEAIDEPTEFAIVFVNEDVRYEYRVAATRERIYYESLSSFPKGSERLWFVREWSETDKTYTFSPDSPKGMPRSKDIEARTLPNMLYLSKAIAENRSEVEPVFRWFRKQLRFLDLSAQPGLSSGYTMRQLHSDNAQSERILSILRHADIGITGANITEDPIVKEQQDSLRGLFSKEEFDKLTRNNRLAVTLQHHTTENHSLSLPWESESTGTHRLFALSGPWIDILDNGYTVCIDELEASLHPHIVRELLKMFHSAEHNPHNAQLIFTTHNPLLLDTNSLMRRDQILFTDKDRTGQSHLYPLTDYKPRREESLVRGYMVGRYGGVPFIPDGLLGNHKREILEDE